MILLKCFLAVIFTAILLGAPLQSVNSGVELLNNKNTSTNISIAKSIEEKKNVLSFDRVELFSYKGKVDKNDNSFFIEGDGASIIKLDRRALKRILDQRKENILFSIPVSETDELELELSQSFPLSEDFKLFNINPSGKKNEIHKSGLHYSGIIRGKENSVASISIFENFVMGVISDGSGNYILGEVNKIAGTNRDEYIFYNDADISVSENFKCGVEGREETFIKAINSAQKYAVENSNTDNSALPVKIY
ncbi:MAG: hypothetical protein ABIY50_05780, partial [Ignavibacteria bacterium]